MVNRCLSFSKINSPGKDIKNPIKKTPILFLIKSFSFNKYKTYDLHKKSICSEYGYANKLYSPLYFLF